MINSLNVLLFPNWNQFAVPCPVLTAASWPAYRYLRRQVRWSGISISFRIFHSLLWSTQLKALALVVKVKLSGWGPNLIGPSDPVGRGWDNTDMDVLQNTHVRTQWKASICKPKREVAGGSQPGHHHDFRFPASRSRRKSTSVVYAPYSVILCCSIPNKLTVGYHQRGVEGKRESFAHYRITEWYLCDLE